MFVRETSYNVMKTSTYCGSSWRGYYLSSASIPVSVPHYQRRSTSSVSSPDHIWKTQISCLNLGYVSSELWGGGGSRRGRREEGVPWPGSETFSTVEVAKRKRMT